MNKMLGVPGRSFHLANGQHYRADDLGNIEVEIGDLAVMRTLRYVEPSRKRGPRTYGNSVGRPLFMPGAGLYAHFSQA